MVHMVELTKITSRDNERLKSVRKIRDGKTAGMIFIEGVRLAEEALRSNISLEDCFVSEEFARVERKKELLDELLRREISVTEVTESIFHSISETINPQGIVLIAQRPTDTKISIEKNLRGGTPLAVFLYEISDPSNLGGILRSAEAAGVAGVIASRGSADVFAPKAVRAAMGSSFRLPVWETADFEEVLTWAADQGLRITAADINAKQVYSQIDWQIPRLLVFGSEAHGLSKDVIERIEDLTYIPMENSVESLNLAVSCGIMLFEAKRQRTAK